MAKTKDELPRWAKILLFLIFAGIIIWAIVPGKVLYISLGIALAIIGGVSYLIYRKWGIQPFKTLAKRTYGWLTESRKQTSIEKVPSLTSRERAQLIDAVGNQCENPNCQIPYPLDIHHIIPKEKGGTNKLRNLIVLCKNCHGMAGKGVYSSARLKQWISRKSPRRFRYYVKWNY